MDKLKDKLILNLPIDSQVVDIINRSIEGIFWKNLSRGSVLNNLKI